jgi:hypothetical protein
MLRPDTNKGKRQASEREDREFERRRAAKLRQQLKPGGAYIEAVLRTLKESTR